MSLIKDWREDTQGYVLTRRVFNFFDITLWLRLHKYRKQRADRGWSDRDTWGAEDHIAKMTAEMLQHLQDHSYCDWPEWFRLNIKEEGKGAYRNLQSVIDDIKNYLVHTESSWSDGLYCDSAYSKDENGVTFLEKQLWFDEKTDKIQTEAAIKNRINRWNKEEIRLYKKAQKAMEFFARHFASFWD
jgi:hypothetical protein